MKVTARGHVRRAIRCICHLRKNSRAIILSGPRMTSRSDLHPAVTAPTHQSFVIRSAATMIRVALIGYGYAGRTFHAPLIRATRGLELVAVNSRNAQQVHADLPDVVVVPSAT